MREHKLECGKNTFIWLSAIKFKDKTKKNITQTEQLLSLRDNLIVKQ